MDPHLEAAIRELESKSTEYLGSPVTITCAKDKSGEIRIQYADLEILQGILERIGAIEPDF